MAYSDLQVYEVYRNYLQHEDELANRRMTWMLTIQGFMYAAYALLVQKRLDVTLQDHPIVRLLLPATPDSYAVCYLHLVIFIIAGTGICISLIARRSIKAAEQAGKSLQQVFEEKQFNLDPAGFIINKSNIIKTVTFRCGIVLPNISGGGMEAQIMRGIFAYNYIPIVVVVSWSLISALELWSIWSLSWSWLKTVVTFLSS